MREGGIVCIDQLTAQQQLSVGKLSNYPKSLLLIRSQEPINHSAYRLARNRRVQAHAKERRVLQHNPGRECLGATCFARRVCDDCTLCVRSAGAKGGRWK